MSFVRKLDIMARSVFVVVGNTGEHSNKIMSDKTANECTNYCYF